MIIWFFDNSEQCFTSLHTLYTLESFFQQKLWATDMALKGQKNLISINYFYSAWKPISFIIFSQKAAQRAQFQSTLTLLEYIVFRKM